MLSSVSFCFDLFVLQGAVVPWVRNGISWQSDRTAKFKLVQNPVKKQAVNMVLSFVFERIFFKKKESKHHRNSSS
jgi:hypothetical protein